MKRLKAPLLCALSLVLGAGPAALAQQRAASSIGDMQEVIRKMEAVDNNPETPPELKEANGRFLAERRRQLGLMITRRLNALRQYRDNVGPSLSDAERRVIDESVASLEGQLALLKAVLDPSPAAPTEVAALKSPAGLFGPRRDRDAATDVTASYAGPDVRMPPPAPASASPLAPRDDDDDDKADDDSEKGVKIKVSKEFINTSGAIAQDGEISKDGVKGLFKDTFGSDPGVPCIIHIVVWENDKQKEDRKKKEGEKKDEKEEAKRLDHWYLYRDEKLFKADDEGGLRIYGSKKVAVLIVHINALPTWDITYNVKATKKIPANILDVQRLAEFILKRAEFAEPPQTGLWGGDILKVPTPSNIKATAKVEIKDKDGKKTQDEVAFNSEVYDDEGRYYWDVSLGMPVQGVKELQYKADDGVVRPRELKRENAYGFLNIFPTKVDVKGDDFLRWPHLVMGVPISGKPLDRPVIALGAGIGKKKFFVFDAFAGVVFNRVREPSTLSAGDAATENELQSDLRSRRVRKFIFGVNFPVSIFTGLLDSGKKKE
jgi:hypothetical protein